MAHHPPPLNALRTFEAVARLKSFTKAANELYVTRAAVSHQIKNLEEFLGFPLIIRHARSISLTPAGDAALPKLREGFNSLSDAVHLMQSQQSNANINVWMAPSFASKWLVPRLNRFSKRHPDIDMQISGNASLVDSSEKSTHFMEELFRSKDVDVVVRFGSGDYSGCHVQKLFSVEAVPLCSPRLRDDPKHPLLTPDDLKHHTLLHDRTDYMGRPEWSKWLEAAKTRGINVKRGLKFNHVSLAMEAAMDGQGVLMSIKSLAKHDIEAGRLCIPFDLSLPLEMAYYIIRPESAVSNQYAVDAFTDWILEEAQVEA